MNTIWKVEFYVVLWLALQFASALQIRAQSPTYSDLKAMEKATIQRAVVWLENDMIQWREHRHCAACHHGPMYLWSIIEAEKAGVRIDGEKLADLSSWLTKKQARIYPDMDSDIKQNSSMADKLTAEMKGKNELSQPTIYMLNAIGPLPLDHPIRKSAWQMTIDHLALAQNADGSFSGRDAWRPIFNTPSILTLQVLNGLTAASSDLQNEKSKQIYKAARHFLSKNPADSSQQSLALQLMFSASTPDVSMKERVRLTEGLFGLQRSDGGWGQTEQMASDGFATGQALYALNQVGIDRDNSQIARAIAFLVKSQNQDGTWTMVSRPNPENGRPASNLNPITYAATAWAVIGLSQYLNSSPRHSTDSSP